jgi:ubiquinone/menaquinone biosynthesis C-methylase UbiE
MLTAIFDLAMRVSPAARQRIIHFWYQQLSRLDTQGIMPLMNYGYADLDPSAWPIALRAEDQPHRYCLQLYHHVTAAADLRGRDVLEVGCGRGGGAAYVSRQLAPRSLTGLDFSDRAIRFCAARHGTPGLRFVPGDAERLPFADASFDALLNVESSHCYRSMERFAGEAHRVLRPGGCLLHADFRDRALVAHWRKQLIGAGFRVQVERDITRNVVRALDLDHERRQALIERHAPRLIRERFARFAGLRGSPVYEGFRSGRLVYQSFVLQKESRDRRLSVFVQSPISNLGIWRTFPDPAQNDTF